MSEIVMKLHILCNAGELNECYYEHEEDTKDVFSILFIFIHGYASLYANNTMVYDEKSVIKALEKIFDGAVCATKGE